MGKCQEGVKTLESFQDKVRHYDEFYMQRSGGNSKSITRPLKC